ncbi:MAG TPA: CDP-alcohol phosphatidyltransferase family protein [bacterium]|nr:CDP-alcohol phosphatidyltransferase family protein [bacterium]HPL95436.1 CDP-alcohol phosphatidyltransferase family protein [bacterium]
MLKLIGKKLSDIHDQLRLGKDRFFKPLIKPIPNTVTPNHITAGRLILIIAWFILSLVKPAWWQIIIFFVVYFFDLVDGALARIREQKTKFGFYFDPLTDRFNHLVLYCAVLRLTAGQLSVLKFFIIWEAVALLFIIAEIFSCQEKILWWRVFWQVTVKISLWVALFYQFELLYLNLW